MIDGICRELDALCARIDARDARIETMLADCLAAIERVIEQRRQRDAADIDARRPCVDVDTLVQQPDPWEAGGNSRLTRGLEALVSDARARGIPDEEILAKVLATANRLRKGLS